MKKAIEDQSLLLKVLNRQGVALCKEGKLEEAEQIFLQALALGQSFVNLDKMELESTMIRLAALYNRQGRKMEASQVINKARAIDPENLASIADANIEAAARIPGKLTVHPVKPGKKTSTPGKRP